MRRLFALALTALTVAAGLGASGASAKRTPDVKSNHRSHVQVVRFATGAPARHVNRRAFRGLV